MIRRTIQTKIEEKLFKGKIIIIYGARQVGKTTLAKEILQKYPNSKYLLCDNPDIKHALENRNATELVNFLGNSKFFVLDEAQNIENIGTTLKILVDTYPEIQIIATGSSSFDLSNKVLEPLTGRVYEFELFPLSYREILDNIGTLEAKRNLTNILQYGMYPEIFLNSNNEKIEILENIKSSYLFKDILAFRNIRNSEVLMRVLQLLALQIGSEVSYPEIASMVAIDIKTLQKYLDLLEKIFIIKKLPALSRNLRNEVTKSRKIYFYDLGIRNALIRNFNPVEVRDDLGKLWENFMVIEFIKNYSNNRDFANFFFWRTWEQQEIDLIIEKDGIFKTYEFKYSTKKINKKVPSIFAETYPNHSFNIINSENFVQFL